MESVKVGIKFRPILDSDESKETFWTIKNRKIKSNNGKYSSNSFNNIFGIETTNDEIYNKFARPIVDKVFEGANGTIFAYGQTASGKTHTMMGNTNLPGLITLAIDDIFQKIDGSKHNDKNFIIRIGYMEIYNDKIYDLFDGRKNIVNIYEVNGNVTINQREFTVINKDELMKYFESGNACKKTAETNNNEISSRSHTIFRITIDTWTNLNDNNSNVITSSHLYLVDLAGSEKPSIEKSVSFHEGLHINKSLLYLGKIIREMGKKKSNLKKASFRECKLTRILLPALNESCQVAVICTVAPNVMEETHRTICFAQDIKKVKTYPNLAKKAQSFFKSFNKESSDSLSSTPSQAQSDFQSVIEELRNEIAKLETEKVQLMSEIKSLKISLNKREKAFYDLQRRLTSSELEIQDINIKSANLIHELKLKYEEQKPTKDYEATSNSKEVELEKIIKELNCDLKLFQDASCRNELTMKEMESKMKMLESESYSLRSMYEKKMIESHSEYGKVVHEKNQKIDDLNMKLRELSTAESERRIGDLKLYFELEKHYSLQLEEYETTVKQKDDEITILKSNLSTVEKENFNHLETLNHLLNKQVEEIETKDDEISSLKRKIKEFDNFKANQDVKEMEIKKLTSKLNAVVNEKEMIKKDFHKTAESVKKMEDLEQEFESRMKNSLKTYQKLLLTKNCDILKLRKSLKNKSSEYLKLQKQLDDSKISSTSPSKFKDKLKSLEFQYSNTLQSKNAEIMKLKESLKFHSENCSHFTEVEKNIDRRDIIYDIEYLKTILDVIKLETDLLKFSSMEKDFTVNKVFNELKRFKGKMLDLGFQPQNVTISSLESDTDSELQDKKLSAAMRGGICPYCRRDFMRKSALTRHIRIKHLSPLIQSI